MALKAKRIEDSNLGLSFVRVADFIFDTSSVLVQPTEVQLQQKLENVKGLHLSIYSIVSVEELGGPSGKGSSLKFKKNKSNLISFPSDQNPPVK